MYIQELVVFVKTHSHLFRSFTSERLQHKICAHPSKTALLSKSILGMAPRIYNKLPEHLRIICEISKFKAYVKEYLTKKAYYSCNEFLSDNLE